jgi:tol-pal system protein YbgF
MIRLPLPSAPLRPWQPWAAACLLLLSMGAQASIFADDEARRAILDLRQRLEAVQKRQADDQDKTNQSLAALAKANEENVQLRRSLLDLGNQIEQLRAELSRLRGQDEQLGRDTLDVQRQVAEVQRRLKDVSSGVEDRFRQMEPVLVTVDGREFLAGPAEVSDFEAALGVMRRGEFAQAQSAFSTFVRRHPGSGYLPSALFWLGNAQYATRNHKEAIASLRRMLSEAPDHARAPEAMLAVANAQLELKEPRPAVRRTLEELVKAYPQSEAAAVAKDRLSKLK